jgi:hypothetical protein
MKNHVGLGDTLHELFNVTGIATVVKKSAKVVSKLTGISEDCGCDSRKEYLNNKFPYKK